MPIKSVTSLLLACSLRAMGAEPAAQGDNESDKIDREFRSPDGLFGLQVIDDTPGYPDPQVVLVEWATKRVLKVLSDPERPEYSGKARLDWTADSQRVAAYTGGRHDGDTTIFVRDGDSFVKVEMPELPELPDKPSAKVAKKHKGGFPRLLTDYNLKFDHWLPSGVVLNLSNSYSGPTGILFWKIEITLAIDAKHRATITHTVKKEEVFEG